MNVSMYVTIEKFETEEQGGDLETIHYSITLKEYREVTIRQIKVSISTKKATISGPGIQNRYCAIWRADVYSGKRGLPMEYFQEILWKRS